MRNTQEISQLLEIINDIKNSQINKDLIETLAQIDLDITDYFIRKVTDAYNSIGGEGYFEVEISFIGITYSKFVEYLKINEESDTLNSSTGEHRSVFYMKYRSLKYKQLFLRREEEFIHQGDIDSSRYFLIFDFKENEGK